ncbi:MAG TPA: hydrogenase maturation nickel metallochaperone HypA [Solirubrobacteraceae bacterium]|jgi:hydrogenase nickel incorporation protein HypA/HybF|nr:hydrogenase maturation nickel metallochaperone HypA [Solirubrobacteraceae bacterium]
MHELSLSSAVVNTAVKHAGGRRVEVVNLRIGKLRQVVPDTLEFYFAFVAGDTVCEGAKLNYEIIDARLRCNPCAKEWGIEIPAFRCPHCGGSDVEVASGNEFEVESLEVGPPEEALQGRPAGDLEAPADDPEIEEAECIAPR